MDSRLYYFTYYHILYIIMYYFPYQVLEPSLSGRNKILDAEHVATWSGRINNRKGQNRL